ncbi:esterase-like activity of phytase family protein [Streptomyces sp. NBC_00121]|uniref:esterase-like activity of phytase family protein n=1 Tax=unclassified Streptomyces TaxID=2593676 RepID=UPI0028C3F8EE|nr:MULTISPECIES: esterase-like activity of phytase family protein [unclassified Streptomyces]WNO66250.1 esterase-like activity of phytase family protein [Streptomyces sp. AM2-3-1]WSC70785.1 esterase-like activity of phytase family protein [Streptomyces sp. NBC_01760]WTE61263.1 esterase-like activity of phytase family protein [Streptomyces sp. NBC_01617]WTI88677.1 esterase-like activity of phytase family protein [Streptomyces sp. NBC_00724]
MTRPARRRVAVAAVSALAVSLLLPAAADATTQSGPEQGVSGKVVRTSTLPDIPLATFSNSLLHHSVADDHGVDLGGIGSDLFPAGRRGEFWTVTDRGPNGQIKIDGVNRRTFPVPGFDPAIVKVKVEGSRLEILKALPIRTRSGAPVTGLSNQSGRDENPYTYDASTPLGFNPDGLDTEGIVRSHDGTFWLVDEYGPSLVHVSATGRVLTRYVPEGLALKGADYPVVEGLPSVFLTRKGNRGFEGLAQLPGGDLVIALQSPLLNPSKQVGEASGTTRLLRFSPRRGKVTAEYAYAFDPVGTVDPGEDDPTELKVSSVVATGPDTLLVQERTDRASRLHRVVLRPGNNILGTAWDSTATTPSLEALPNPAAAGVPVLSKKLVVDLNTVPGAPKKIEGVAVVDSRTIAVINDNDFGMTDGAGAFGPDGRLVDSGVETTLVQIRLDARLR